MAEEGLSGKEGYDKFNALDYLKGRYDNLDSKFNPSLRLFHEIFQSLPSGLSVLDYGTGPALSTTISASTKASEIVLSDYAPDSREALRLWLDKKPDAFDWTPFFSRVVKGLEGKGDKEVEERQELVRSVVKAVVHCDLTQDPPIERGYDREYDVVMSSLVLESVVETSVEYKISVEKLVKLVKPGGLLLIQGIEQRSGTASYLVGDLRFRGFYITTELAVEAMTEAGLTEITYEKLADVPCGGENMGTLFFFKGVRK